MRVKFLRARVMGSVMLGIGMLFAVSGFVASSTAAQVTETPTAIVEATVTGTLEGSPTATVEATITATLEGSPTGTAEATATPPATLEATTTATTEPATQVPPPGLTNTATNTPVPVTPTALPPFPPCPQAEVVLPTATEAVTPEVTPTGPKVVHETRLNAVTMPGQFDVVHQVLDFPPGAMTSPQMHPGLVSAIVIEGELTRCTFTGQQTFIKGGNWEEQPGEVTQIVNTGDTPARLSIVFLVPPGAESMTIVATPTVTP